jgi:hypothetical protein
MRILGKSSENEMISLFISEEIKSARYKNNILEIINTEKIDRNIIDNPDLNNKKDNKLRKLILKKFRGYNNKGIFTNFPKKVDWNWALLDKEDILRIKYISYDYWEELSNGTRYAKDSVENIRNGVEVFGVSNRNFVNISEYIKNGKELDPLIIMAPVENKLRMIVLEGHARLTGMNLAIKYISEIKVLLGLVKEKKLYKWNKY